MIECDMCLLFKVHAPKTPIAYYLIDKDLRAVCSSHDQAWFRFYCNTLSKEEYLRRKLSESL